MPQEFTIDVESLNANYEYVHTETRTATLADTEKLYGMLVSYFQEPPTGAVRHRYSVNGFRVSHNNAASLAAFRQMLVDAGSTRV